MKHTKGPWRLKELEDSFLDIGIGVTRIALLDLAQADPTYPEEEIWSNARIMTAAPELYEAACNLDLAICDHMLVVPTDILNRLNELRKAIDKAEGKK